MHYPETSESASKFALSAIKRMQKLDLPANPLNFAIWYEYFAGKNSNLKQSVDKLITDKNTIGADDFAEIYERYIKAGACDKDRNWSERIDSVAERIVKALSAAGTGTAEYGEALENFSGSLDKASSIDQIRHLVVEIIEETNSMDVQSRELQKKMQESAEAITELRQALEESRRDALTDGLTGIPNRKCFDQDLHAGVTETMVSGEPLSLIFADVDHFNQFNDMHGHALGDQVLRLVGKILHDCVKGQDTAARYGGEEFAVILPDTTSGGATAVAESIRKTVNSKKLVSKGGTDDFGAVTISLGVTTYATGEAISDFMERADQALYLAKKLGRNRVMYEEAGQTALPAAE
ncbi:MAG: GGDEF domain-containing protein [Alphaproteobacteria bacterium]